MASTSGSAATDSTTTTAAATIPITNKATSYPASFSSSTGCNGSIVDAAVSFWTANYDATAKVDATVSTSAAAAATTTPNHDDSSSFVPCKTRATIRPKWSWGDVCCYN